MEFSFLLILIGAYAAGCFVQAQNRGFISLDCGLMPKDASYTERVTNIKYISDSDYINAGESNQIKPEYKQLLQQQTWFLRSFPKGKRNCYSVKVEEKQKYLIRASFVYGNYDGLNKLPNFDLYLGPNKWTTVTFEGMAEATAMELIHIVASNDLQVCLVKTGTTTPFISSLEIRPLEFNTYSTRTGSLLTFSRSFLASNSSNFIRFDKDIRDRLWVPLFRPMWTEVRTTDAIGTTGTGYDIPELALKTAATPTDPSESLTFFWDTVEANGRYYVFLHFAEIENLKANESREFNTMFNGNHMHGPFSPRKFSLFTLYTIHPLFSLDGRYEFSLIRTENSTHPPLLNAIEIYKLIEFKDLETDQSDVDAMKKIEETYRVSKNSWQGDPCLPVEYTWEGLICSYKQSTLPRITSLNMSTSGLTGNIPPYIANLTLLEKLDLSNNSLTGEVPEFLATMPSLLFIDLSGNKLSGYVPSKLLERKKDGLLTLVVEGNSNLCPSGSCKNKNENEENYKNLLIPIGSSVASLVVVLSISAIWIFHLRKRKTKQAEAPTSPLMMNSETEMSEPSRPSIMRKEWKYAYSDIKRMTSNFQEVLGKGGFGVVYKGHLNNTEQVAVKMLSQSTSQGYKQFKTEVEVLLRVHHRNLVGLVGYCAGEKNFALIYEFMANGDLHEHLSGKRGSSIMNWASRVRIAAEAAQGLEYLHSGCKLPIVHRDVKTSNILLNENFQAKLADFGLSRSFTTEGATHVSTVVAGTMGYVDPDYFRTNRLTEKSDVFSFGVVLLEIITNRLVIDNTRERPHIAEWVKSMLREDEGMKKIIDPKLGGNYNSNAAWKMVELALACVNQVSWRRPTMSHVVMVLNKCFAMENPRMQGEKNEDSRSL